MRIHYAWVKESGVWHFIEECINKGKVTHAENGQLVEPFDFGARVRNAENVDGLQGWTDE